VTKTDSPLFLPSVAIAAGMGLSSVFETGNWFFSIVMTGVIAGLAAIGLICCDRRLNLIQSILALTALSAASGAWYFVSVYMVRSGDIMIAPPVGEVAVVGRIKSLPLPTRTGGRIDVEINGLETSQRCLVKRGGTVRLTLGSDLWSKMVNNPNFAPGAGIRFETELTRPVGYRNPGVFDPSRQLINNGIHLSGYVEYDEFIRIISPPSLSARILWYFRREITDHINQSSAHENQRLYTHSTTDAGVSAALLLGSRGELCPETRIVFQETGLVHLLAISGLHIGIIAAVVLWILKRFPGNLYSRSFVLIITIWLYAVFTGNSASVVRAGLMVSLFMTAGMLARPATLLNTVATAAIIILIARPGMVRDPGFQLTFSATMGIALLYPGFSRMFKWIPSSWLRGVLSVSFAAQFATAPVSAFWFNRFGFLTAIAGLPLIPLTAIALVTGWTGVLLAFINLNTCLKIHYHIVDFIIYYAHRLHSITGVTIPVTTPSVFAAIALFGLMLLSKFNRRNTCFVLCYSVVTMVVLIIPTSVLSANTGLLEVWFLDVGNGDCIIIRLPDGKVMLVDAGGIFNSEVDIGEQVVVRALRSIGIKRVHIAVITHPHPDHQLGMHAVIRHMNPQEIWVLDENTTQNDFVSILRKATQNGMVVRSLEERNIFDVFPLCENNRSIILGIRFGRFKLLLTGDAEREAEAALLDYDGYLNADVLKVGHHGSQSSSSEDFIEAVSPQMAIITSGYGNQFGHPHSETLKTLKKIDSDMTVLRSDIHGMIYIVTDGVIMKSYRGGQTLSSRLF
jgi:competence protein ComEC